MKNDLELIREYEVKFVNKLNELLSLGYFKSTILYIENQKKYYLFNSKEDAKKYVKINKVNEFCICIQFDITLIINPTKQKLDNKLKNAIKNIQPVRIIMSDQIENYKLICNYNENDNLKYFIGRK